MQAARGASLNTSDQHTPSSRRRFLILFGVIALVAYGIDQVTKILAVEHLNGGDKVPFIGDLVTLTLVHNPGAAFGTGTGHTWIFTSVAIVATVAVLYVATKVRDRLWAVGFGLLLAGIVGNLTDRLFREPRAFHGHVVDFLQLPNWPVFNIADICINAAAVLIVVQTLRGVGLDGSREHDTSKPDEVKDEA